MIRYLDNSEKLRCRRLWNQAFPQDSEAFVDYYFNHKACTGRVLVKEGDKGDILTMAHLNPYQVKVKDKLWTLDYIVGVATDKDSRHQGHMRDVLVRMFSDMYEAGAPFCYLMPASPDIYRPFGFTYIFDQPHWKLAEEKKAAAKRVELRLDGPLCPGLDSSHSAERLDSWINRWLDNRYEVYAMRGPSYMKMLQRELDSENGHVYGWFDQKGLAALEAFWGLGKQEQRFLYCDRDGWTEPFDSGAFARPAIMARITNVRELAQVISVTKDCPCDSMEVAVRIRDRHIPGNSGLWRWALDVHGSSLQKAEHPALKRGEMAEYDELPAQAGDGPDGERGAASLREVCKDTASKEGRAVSAASLNGGAWEGALRSTETLDISIEQLTAWLFGYCTLKEAMGPEGGETPFWCRYVQPIRGVFLDEIV